MRPLRETRRANKAIVRFLYERWRSHDVFAEGFWGRGCHIWRLTLGSKRAKNNLGSLKLYKNWPIFINEALITKQPI